MKTATRRGVACALFFVAGPTGLVTRVEAASRARHPDITFVHEAQLLPDNGNPGDMAGSWVSISGDTAVVGVSTHDTPGGSNAGAAYVFVKSGTSWTQQQLLMAPDGAANDAFGWRVSVSGDTIVVGAPGDDSPIADAGSAYVFVRSGTTWTLQQKLLAFDADLQDDFGSSVAASGDTVVVGARKDDTPSGLDAGSAYVFVRSGAVWSLQKKLEASDSTTDLYFGHSAALDGDTAVIGAPLGVLFKGAAYVFVRSGTVWTQQPKLVASDEAPDNNFGIAVAISGQTLVGGALFGDGPGGTNTGAAYVFVSSGSNWSEQQKLVASDGAPGDNFGAFVAVFGDLALVGAHLHDIPAMDIGSAYVYERSGATWTEQQQLQPPSGAPGSLFGLGVALSGDAACMGAPGDSPTGSAHVFRAMVPVQLQLFSVE